MNKVWSWIVKIFAGIVAILGAIFMLKQPDVADDEQFDNSIKVNQEAETEVKRKIEILNNDKKANKDEIEKLKKELKETQTKIEDLKKEKQPVTADEAYDWLKEFANDD